MATSLVSGFAVFLAVIPMMILYFLPAFIWGGRAGGEVISLVLALAYLPVLIYVAVRLSYWVYVLVDQRKWGSEALRISWNVTKGKVLLIIAFGVVLALINVAGAILLLLGLVVTLPMTFIAIARIYRILEAGSASNFSVVAS